MPATETTSSGGLSFADHAPSARPSYGTAATERPPVAAPASRGNPARVAVDEGERSLRLEEAHHPRPVAQEHLDPRIAAALPSSLAR